jgi:light-regulated signal transduction histidine kinase (bacteriophytochrome)
MKLRGVLDSDTERYMEHILTGAERLEALIRDLLGYTQAADANSPPAVETHSSEALNQALSNLAAAIEETGAEVSVLSLPTVRVAPLLLMQCYRI